MKNGARQESSGWTEKVVQEQETTLFSGIKLGYDCFFGFNDLERTDVLDEIWISCCSCVKVRIYLDLPSNSELEFILFSGSMEPAFQRGDILFLNNQDDPIRVGEIVVFKIKDRDIPIVHRVMKVHEKDDGKVLLQTTICLLQL